MHMHLIYYKNTEPIILGLFACTYAGEYAPTYPYGTLSTYVHV